MTHLAPERSDQIDEARVAGYEAPKLYVIGSVTAFTFGSGGIASDAGGTRKLASDGRLKRAVMQIEDPIDKLRAI